MTQSLLRAPAKGFFGVRYAMNQRRNWARGAAKIGEPGHSRTGTLGGGNALGAYHGGAFAVMAAEDVRVDWIAGSSIGAITAALIAGSAPERREATLREFWQRAAASSGEASWVPKEWRQPLQVASALRARLFGRPALFHPRLLDRAGRRANQGSTSEPVPQYADRNGRLRWLNDGPTRSRWWR